MFGQRFLLLLPQLNGQWAFPAPAALTPLQVLAPTMTTDHLKEAQTSFGAIHLCFRLLMGVPAERQLPLPVQMCPTAHFRFASTRLLVKKPHFQMSTAHHSFALPV
ncbi:hypothetical protein [Paenibacillus polymyxa]|uniref:hypothetical protein n=1 Tax=Paenibacillus polymyxa TaxID=1406 RepID=UPI003977821C